MPSPARSMSPIPPVLKLSGSSVLTGEVVALCGGWGSVTRGEAKTLVEQHGGRFVQQLSRQTTMLVVGEADLGLDDDGQPHRVVRQAETWHTAGDAQIRIVSESEWLHLLGVSGEAGDVRRLHSAIAVARLLDVPTRKLRQWERIGLIRPVKTVFRLSYYNFDEVAHARRLSDLLASGVSQREIEAGLRRLRELLGEEGNAFSQLELLAGDRCLLYRDDRGPIEATSGQRRLDFSSDSAAPSDHVPETIPLTMPKADDPLERGLRELAEGDPELACMAFRDLLQTRPDDPEILALLADAEYRCDRVEKAAALYERATKLDPEYLEASLQLGCLLVELGERGKAANAFRAALTTCPDFADAHWHLAELHAEQHEFAEALTHWTKCIRAEERGPWAELARQRIAASENRS